MSEYIKKSDALDFADWFHYWILNIERREVEQEFESRNIKSINFEEMVEKKIWCYSEKYMECESEWEDEKYLSYYYWMMNWLNEILQELRNL